MGVARKPLKMFYIKDKILIQVQTTMIGLVPEFIFGKIILIEQKNGHGITIMEKSTL